MPSECTVCLDCLTSCIKEGVGFAQPLPSRPFPPTPEKALCLEKVSAVNEFDEEIELQQPYVLRDLCIGCGICENHCPLEGEAAIRVYGV